MKMTSNDIPLGGGVGRGRTERTWLTGNAASMCCLTQNTSYAKFEEIVKGVESAGIVEPDALLVGHSSSQMYRSAFV